MQEREMIDSFAIDKEKLNDYFQRVRHSLENPEFIHSIAYFLHNTQSIGAQFEDVKGVLTYYEDKLESEKTGLDFAFEWIRANKIRFEYLKHLANSQFPNLEVAVDDSLFSFFLRYDIYVRKLLKKNIHEFEISALYEIFFNSNKERIIIIDILDKHEANVPTVFCQTTKVDTKLITLRFGISEIVKKDYTNIQAKI